MSTVQDELETTWSLAQIAVVRSLRGEYEVGVEAKARYPEIVEQAARKAARRLIDMAETSAVVPHIDDFRWRVADQTDEDRARNVHRLGVWWEPRTRTVEILGLGERDGERWEVPNAPGSIRVTRETAMPAAYMDADPTALATPEVVVLEVIGWREQARHWVYARRADQPNA